MPPHLQAVVFSQVNHIFQIIHPDTMGEAEYMDARSYCRNHADMERIEVVLLMPEPHEKLTFQPRPCRWTPAQAKAKGYNLKAATLPLVNGRELVDSFIAVHRRDGRVYGSWDYNNHAYIIKPHR